ncbi:MAG: molybdate ABC transporter substrate-binding protein [Pseudomonadota bacterium]
MFKYALAPLLILVITSFFANASTARPITIFAAASLQGPLDKVVAAWGGAARVSYAGSGTIARQISLGAPADVVMLASPQWMTWLAERDLLATAPQSIVSGTLVLVGPDAAPDLNAADADALLARLGDGRLAMGHHAAVPAGTYAAEWLQAIDAWTTVRPHLAETENVRAALALVARGEAPLGIVYASDAQAEPAVRVLYKIPAELHKTISYPAAAVTENGSGFVEFLTTQSEVFEAAGFRALP